MDQLSGLLYPAIWVDNQTPHGTHYTGEFVQLLNKINEIIVWSVQKDVFESEVDDAFALQTDQIATLQTWVNTWDNTLEYWDLLIPGILATLDYLSQVTTDNAAGITVNRNDIDSNDTDISALQNQVALLDDAIFTALAKELTASGALTQAEVNDYPLINLSAGAAGSFELALPSYSPSATTVHPVTISTQIPSGGSPIKLYLPALEWANGAPGDDTQNYLMLDDGEAVVLFPGISGVGGGVVWNIIGGKTYADLESDP